MARQLRDLCFSYVDIGIAGQAAVRDIEVAVKDHVLAIAADSSPGDSPIIF